MCGVDNVAISLGSGRISLVEIGITSSEGESFVDISTFDGEISVGIAIACVDAVGTASGESPLGEQAHRIRVQKRSVGKILCIRTILFIHPFPVQIHDIYIITLGYSSLG
jgi:hypothetical protein